MFCGYSGPLLGENRCDFAFVSDNQKWIFLIRLSKWGVHFEKKNADPHFGEPAVNQDWLAVLYSRAMAGRAY